MSTKQTRKRFSLEFKYKVIKLMETNTHYPKIVDQFKDDGLRLRNIYDFKSQKSEIIKAFETSKASNGFLHRFKSRNKIVYHTIHGDANGVPEWINIKLPELVKEYDPKDIFNGDKFGLFWRIPPNRSYIVKGQKFKNGKRSKERVSVFICANSLGTEKQTGGHRTVSTAPLFSGENSRSCCLQK